MTMLDDLARLQPSAPAATPPLGFQSLAVAGFHAGRRYSCRIVAVEYTDSFALLMAAVNGHDAAGIIAAGGQLPRLVLNAS